MKVSRGTFQCECVLKQTKKKETKQKQTNKKSEPNFYYTKLYVKVWKQLKISGNIRKT